MRQVTVYHSFYGCDTGCCGHRFTIDGVEQRNFTFEHPQSNETPLEFAKRILERELGKEHCRDLDWDNAVVTEVGCPEYTE